MKSTSRYTRELVVRDQVHAQVDRPFLRHHRFEQHEVSSSTDIVDTLEQRYRNITQLPLYVCTWPRLNSEGLFMKLELTIALDLSFTITIDSESETIYIPA